MQLRACVRIQRTVRGHLDRQTLRAEHFAATLIQSQYRGRKARTGLKRRKEEQRHEREQKMIEERLDASQKKIAQFYRKQKEWKESQRIRAVSAASTLQNWYRTKHALLSQKQDSATPQEADEG